MTHALLMGMGGSSLAPDVLRTCHGVRSGYLDVQVLDTTDPATIHRLLTTLPLERTLFLVASKSGTTAEPLSFHQAFFHTLQQRVGNPGAQFVALTDPGSKLEGLARAQGFRRVFSTPEDVGGRFSALTPYGLVPAALLGMDLRRLLDRGSAMARACAPETPACENPGAVLGAAMAELAGAGRDKLTFVCSPGLAPFGYWVEQLIAESTGKAGKGILPVEGEPVGPPDVYGADRLFCRLRLAGDTTEDAAMARLQQAGHPVINVDLADIYDLGGEFFRWEMATAVAGGLLGINPFDQPNVEDSKQHTRQALTAFEQTGALPEDPPTASEDGLELYDGEAGPSIHASLRAHLTHLRPGGYVAIMAYVERSPAPDAALQEIRRTLRDSFRVAATLGYGPRFLHSTGQFHKGGPNTGVFLQITADPAHDVPVPGTKYTFGTLIRAQAIGDGRALRNNGRRFLRIILSAGVEPGLRRLLAMVRASANG